MINLNAFISSLKVSWICHTYNDPNAPCATLAKPMIITLGKLNSVSSYPTVISKRIKTIFGSKFLAAGVLYVNYNLKIPPLYSCVQCDLI